MRIKVTFKKRQKKKRKKDMREDKTIKRDGKCDALGPSSVSSVNLNDRYLTKGPYS